MNLNFLTLLKPQARPVTAAQSKQLDTFCQALVKMRQPDTAAAPQALTAGLAALFEIAKQVADTTAITSGWQAGLVQRPYSGGTTLIVTKEDRGEWHELNVQFDARGCIYAASWTQRSGDTIQDVLLFRVTAVSDGWEFRLEDGQKVYRALLPALPAGLEWTDAPTFQDIPGSRPKPQPDVNGGVPAAPAPSASTIAADLPETARQSPPKSTLPPPPPSRATPPPPAVVSPPSITAPACSRCGNALRPGVKFCDKCGAAVTAPSQTACPQCGSQVRPGVKFCGNCGAKQA